MNRKFKDVTDLFHIFRLNMLHPSSNKQSKSISPAYGDTSELTVCASMSKLN
jgi:hypothetical protein